MNNNDPTTGKLLRLAREKQGLSRKGLASKADIALHTITGIESERREPNLATLRILAQALDVDVRDLVGAAHDTQKPRRGSVQGKQSGKRLYWPE